MAASKIRLGRWPLFLVVLLFAARSTTVSARQHATVYFNSSARFPFSIKIGVTDLLNGVAVGSYEPRGIQEGWNKLKVHGLNRTDAKTAAKGMGFLEGYITQASIYNISQNNYADWFSDQESDNHPGPVFDWLEENYEWMKGETARQLQRQGIDGLSGSPPAAYWTTVDLLTAQFEGMMLGYNQKAPKKERLTREKFLLLNSDGDVESIVNLPSVHDALARLNITAKAVKRKQAERCSAIWKYDSVAREIYFGHTTWDNFDMASVRQLKSYKYEFAGMKAVEVSMSSSPGFLSSVDDFYLTSNKLAVIETTNGNFNKKLWGKVTTKSVLSWVRSMVSNVLAEGTKEWTDMFCLENSGTYNNQWMVLDLEQFKEFQSDRSMEHLPADTFRVLEQLPGTCATDDMTAHLESDGYWASYNIPFFYSVWKDSGFGTKTPKTYYSHDDCPRAKMFAARNGKVADLDGVKSLLRYNDFKNDPNADGNACFGISSRCDLNPTASKSFRLEGGIDSKATTASLAYNMIFVAQNGPTHDNQPPFNWTLWEQATAPPPGYSKLPVHTGAPESFNFDWIGFGGH